MRKYVCLSVRACVYVCLTLVSRDPPDINKFPSASVNVGDTDPGFEGWREKVGESWGKGKGKG